MRKRHSAAFKAQVVQEVLKEEKTITQIASEYGVHPNQISTWKAAALKGLPSLFEREKADADQRAQKEAHEKQLQELYAQIGRLSTQVAWLKKKSGLEPPSRGTVGAPRAERLGVATVDAG
jgi:putative transposase